MFGRTQRKAATLVAALGCALAGHTAWAAEPVQLSGAISGKVLGGSGIPQMGAVVVLYDRQQREYSRALTNQSGQFLFSGLLPSAYSVRVTLAAFVPAVRRDILVQPGMRSLLTVNLSALFSSIQLSYPAVENGSLMTDEWKWGLRTDTATRPILRLVNDPKPNGASASRGSVFADTRGLLRVSGGDAPPPAAANEADMGAAFALATSLFGNNTLEVSGNFGVGGQTGAPAAAFRTGYSRRSGGNQSQASVTVRQLSLPGRMGGNGADSSLPALRTMSASVDERMEIFDGLVIQYGVSADSVTFLDRLTYLSPYARLSYALDAGTDMAFAYTSGNARPDLAGQAPGEADLQRDLSTLGMFPRLSLRDSHAKIQRGEEYELTFGRKLGSRKVEASVFNEAVKNAALTMVAPDGFFSGADLLPDLFSGNSILNAGNYRSMGYSLGITQNLGQNLSAALNFGSMGALTVTGRELASNSPDELRTMIRAGRKNAATARVTATSPWTGTHLVASYQWSDKRWAMAGHMYSTQSSRTSPGLNVVVRQPVPGISGRPCRVEVTADLRNLLAEGYLPLSTAASQSVLLVETPRSIRGGLNLIF